MGLGAKLGFAEWGVVTDCVGRDESEIALLRELKVVGKVDGEASDG